MVIARQKAWKISCMQGDKLCIIRPETCIKTVNKASFDLVVTSCVFQSVSGRTVKDTVQEWNRYRNECIMKISSQPTPSGRH